MNDAPDFDDAIAAEEPSERRLAQVRRERDSARAELRRLEADHADLARQLEILTAIDNLDPTPPKWLTRTRKASERHGTITTILSDLHLDETVNPDEIGGVNAYDRDIAVRRLRSYFDQLVMVTREMMAGVTFDGAVVMFGGDLISGDIHDELAQTNAGTTLQTVEFWIEHLAAGLDQLADEFGHVHVPVVVGNHGRRTRKPRAKNRAVDNFDWFIGRMVARLLRDDPRVTFDIPEAFFTTVPIYEHTHRLEHGDGARGGSGWMGALGPVMRRETKVAKQAAAMSLPFDHLWVGHWHTYTSLNSLTINGSLKGYDEYAATEAFTYEDPQQALALVVPKRGIVMRAPVLVADRKAEGW